MAKEMSFELAGRDGETTVDTDPYLVCGVIYKEIHLEILDCLRPSANGIRKAIRGSVRCYSKRNTRSGADASSYTAPPLFLYGP
jgi:hypothetical protein